MRICISTLVLIALHVTLDASTATARVWKDATGKYELEAEFVEFKPARVDTIKEGNVSQKKKVSAKVRLRRKSDDRVITLPLSSLSQADQKYVRQVVQEKKVAERKRIAAGEKEAQRQQIIARLAGTWENSFDLEPFGSPKGSRLSETLIFAKDGTGTVKVQVGESVATYPLTYTIDVKKKLPNFTSRGAKGTVKLLDIDTLAVRGHFFRPSGKIDLVDIAVITKPTLSPVSAKFERVDQDAPGM